MCMGVLPALNLSATTRIKEAVHTLEQEIKDNECSLCAQILAVSFRTLKTGAGRCFTVEDKRADVV